MTRVESAGLLAILASLFALLEVPVPEAPRVAEETTSVTWEQLQWSEIEVEGERNALTAATSKTREWFFSTSQSPRHVPQVQSYL